MFALKTITENETKISTIIFPSTNIRYYENISKNIRYENINNNSSKIVCLIE